MIVSPHPHLPRTVVVVWLMAISLILLTAVLRTNQSPAVDSVTFTVKDSSTFSIAGAPAAELRPGVAQHLNLAFSNPASQDLLVTKLVVTIAVVHAPYATPEQPCTDANYRATAGDFTPLRLPAEETVTLVDVGAARESWPTLEMLETHVNQNGCKGAKVVLNYRSVLEAV